MLTFLGGVGAGIGLTTIVGYVFIVRDLVARCTRIRYDGYRPEGPVIKPPKTVPVPAPEPVDFYKD